MRVEQHTKLDTTVYEWNKKFQGSGIPMKHKDWLSAYSGSKLLAILGLD